MKTAIISAILAACSIFSQQPAQAPYNDARDVNEIKIVYVNTTTEGCYAEFEDGTGFYIQFGYKDARLPWLPPQAA